MQEDRPSEFDFRHFWETLKKKRYLALSVGFAVLSIFTWGSFLWPKTYEARSTVFVERTSMIAPLIKGMGVSSDVDEVLKNLKEGFTSRNIIERVMKKLDLDARSKNPKQYEGLIEGIRKNLDITIKAGREKTADLFVISYRGRDPKTVRDVVNTLVSEYIEENMGLRATDAYGAYEFIKTQLLEYKNKLDESDKSIREFREKHPNLVPQNETALLGKIEGLETARLEADIKFKELMKRKETLQKQLSGEKELTVAFVTREGSPQSRLNYLNSQLITLTSKYTDSYPEVIKVKNEIEDLKRLIAQEKSSRSDNQGSETAAMNPVYQQMKEDLAKTNAEAESYRTRANELTKAMREDQSKLGRMPKEQEEWAKLQRDRNVYQKIYDDLVEKLENAKVSKDLEVTNKTGNFKIVDPAIFPPLPAKPNRVLMILAGMALGLASGIGAVFGLEFISHAFHNETSVEAELKLPVLATIPKIITEEDKLSAKQLDRKVFRAAAAYLLIIVLVLAEEFMYRYMGIGILKF